MMPHNTAITLSNVGNAMMLMQVVGQRHFWSQYQCIEDSTYNLNSYCLCICVHHVFVFVIEVQYREEGLDGWWSGQVIGCTVITIMVTPPAKARGQETMHTSLYEKVCTVAHLFLCIIFSHSA